MGKRHHIISRFVFTSALILGFTASAFAQAIPSARFSSASPGRVRETMGEREALPSVVPGLNIQRAKPLNAPVGAEKVRFVLRSVTFQGVTVYSQDFLQRFYADKVGQEISLADVYGIANAVTRQYRDDGYILTQAVVPPQTIEGGHIRLRAVEGILGSVTVENAEDMPPYSLARIQSYIDQVDQNGPLNEKQLERALLLINDLPGVSARTIMSPSRNTPNASDLQIIVSRRIYDGSVAFDNFGTRYMGPYELNLVQSYNSGFNNDEKLSLQAVYAPDTNGARMMLYGAASYLQPVGPYGTTVNVVGTNTTTNPGHTLKQFDVRGVSNTFTTTVDHPFIRSRDLNLSGHVSFDLRHVTTSNNLIGDPKREDSLRILRVGGRFQTLDMLFGPAFNIADLEFSRGMSIMGASPAGYATLSRADGLPTFMKATLELQRLQHLYGPVNLLIAAKGQMTNDPLLSSEQFGVGGTSYGRGYDASEIVGDRGYSAKAELQWNEPYKIDFVQSYQLYAFWDIGAVRNVKTTTAGATFQDSLASVGVGTRVNVTDTASASLLVAFPITREVATHNDKDNVVLFSLGQKF